MSYLDDNAPMPSDMLSHTTGGFFPALSDGVIEAFASHLEGALPSYYEALFSHFHGAVVRVPVQATAFPLRSPGFDFFVTVGAADSAGLAPATEWFRALWTALKPHTQGVYVNVLEEEGQSRAREAYGLNSPRLVALKNQYDPTNFFRLNQNVEPTV